MEEWNVDGPIKGTPEEQPGRTARVRQSVETTADEIGEKARDLKERTAYAARQTAARAAAQVEAQREPAARRLEDTAEGLREGGARFAKTTYHAARVTADKLEATADYIREHDVRAMIDDVEDLVRQHPGPALATAAVVGFLVGRALSNND